MKYYTDAVYVQERFGQLQAVVDSKLNKRFNHHECPSGD